MKYNIITPLSRVENIQNLIDVLEPKNVNWHIIIDDIAPFKLVFYQEWIKQYICPTQGNLFWERCNFSINWFLNTFPLNEDEMYCFLNDDDSYEPDFFEKLNKYDSNLIICSMMRGDQTPSSATGVRAHPTFKLHANPNNMCVGGVGIEQIVLSGKILKNYRLPIHGCGDGMFIEKICRENKATFAEEANVWFNYFEPGRWNK
jgi:hypothetical protein